VLREADVTTVFQQMAQPPDPDRPFESRKLIHASRDLMEGSRGRIMTTMEMIAAARYRLHDARNVLQRVAIERFLRSRRRP
jgi:hypothetical protein